MTCGEAFRRSEPYIIGVVVVEGVVEIVVVEIVIVKIVVGKIAVVEGVTSRMDGAAWAVELLQFATDLLQFRRWQPRVPTGRATDDGIRACARASRSTPQKRAQKSCYRIATVSRQKRP